MGGKDVFRKGKSKADPINRSHTHTYTHTHADPHAVLSVKTQGARELACSSRVCFHGKRFINRRFALVL